MAIQVVKHRKNNVIQTRVEVEEVQEERMETEEEINDEQRQVKEQDTKLDQVQAQTTEHQASPVELVGEENEPIFLHSQGSPSGTPGKTGKKKNKEVHPKQEVHPEETKNTSLHTHSLKSKK